MKRKILIRQTIESEIWVDAITDYEAIEIGNCMIENDMLNKVQGELIEASVEIIDESYKDIFRSNVN